MTADETARRIIFRALEQAFRQGLRDNKGYAIGIHAELVAQSVAKATADEIAKLTAERDEAKAEVAAMRSSGSWYQEKDIDRLQQDQEDAIAERDEAIRQRDQARAVRGSTVEIVKTPHDAPVSSHGGPALGIMLALMVNGHPIMSEFRRVAWGTPVEYVEPSYEMTKAKDALFLALQGGEHG